jgi:hypothetical protein
VRCAPPRRTAANAKAGTAGRGRVGAAGAKRLAKGGRGAGQAAEAAVVETAESLHNKRWAGQRGPGGCGARSPPPLRRCRRRRAASRRAVAAQPSCGLVPEINHRPTCLLLVPHPTHPSPPSPPRDVLLQDHARIKAAIAEEQARLDAAEREQRQAALLAEMEGGGGGGSSGGGGGGGGGRDAGGGGPGGGDEDALDAFMSGVETQMEKDKVEGAWGWGWGCGWGWGWGWGSRPQGALPACPPRHLLRAHADGLGAQQLQLQRRELGALVCLIRREVQRGCFGCLVVLPHAPPRPRAPAPHPTLACGRMATEG